MGTELFHCITLKDPSHRVSSQAFISMGASNKYQLYVRTLYNNK